MGAVVLSEAPAWPIHHRAEARASRLQEQSRSLGAPLGRRVASGRPGRGWASD